MIDSLGAAMAEPIVAVAVSNLVVNAVIGIAVIGLLAALLRRISGRMEERREAAPVSVHSPAPSAVPMQPPADRQAMIAAISATIPTSAGLGAAQHQLITAKKNALRNKKR